MVVVTIPQHELDEIDEKILHYVMKHGAPSHSEIAEEIGKSRSTVYRRVGKLKEKEIIGDESTRIPNFEKIGISMIILNIEVQMKDINNIVEFLKNREEVKLLMKTCGDFDVLAIIMCKQEKENKIIRTLKEDLGQSKIQVKDLKISRGDNWKTINFNPPF